MLKHKPHWVEEAMLSVPHHWVLKNTKLGRFWSINVFLDIISCTKQTVQYYTLKIKKPRMLKITLRYSSFSYAQNLSSLMICI